MERRRGRAHGTEAPQASGGKRERGGENFERARIDWPHNAATRDTPRSPESPQWAWELFGPDSPPVTRTTRRLAAG